jgi:hypothetical protein
MIGVPELLIVLAICAVLALPLALLGGILYYLRRLSRQNDARNTTSR